jgi:hypothetical protein
MARGGSEAALRISGTPVVGGDVVNTFDVSPDGARAVYLADQDVNGQPVKGRGVKG